MIRVHEVLGELLHENLSCLLPIDFILDGDRMSVQENALEEFLQAIIEVLFTGAKLDTEVIAQPQALECNHVANDVFESLAVTMTQHLTYQGWIVASVAYQL